MYIFAILLLLLISFAFIVAVSVAINPNWLIKYNQSLSNKAKKILPEFMFSQEPVLDELFGGIFGSKRKNDPLRIAIITWIYRLSAIFIALVIVFMVLWVFVLYPILNK